VYYTIETCSMVTKALLYAFESFDTDQDIEQKPKRL